MVNLKALFKNEKAVKAIIFGSFALILLVFLSDSFASPNSSKSVKAHESDFSVYERLLEEKLVKAISAIEGVNYKELTVVVTLDSLSETVYAERGSSVRTVITPKVRGVAVVCENGDNVIVKQKIIELVSRVLGISSIRISVTN